MPVVERKTCGCYVKQENIKGNKSAECAQRECKLWDRCLDAGRQGEPGFGDFFRKDDASFKISSPWLR